MALRTGHGKGAGSPRIEVLPPDELPSGVQATAQAEGSQERRADGTFAKGARTAQSKGGHTRKGAVALAARLSLGSVTASDAFAPYKRASDAFRKAKCSELAQAVGGGVCGAGPSAIVASAALQLAASRFLFDRASETGDASTFAQASKLADASRQNLLAAHELCAREAQARALAPSADDPFAEPRGRR